METDTSGGQGEIFPAVRRHLNLSVTIPDKQDVSSDIKATHAEANNEEACANPPSNPPSNAPSKSMFALEHPEMVAYWTATAGQQREVDRWFYKPFDPASRNYASPRNASLNSITASSNIAETKNSSNVIAARHTDAVAQNSQPYLASSSQPLSQPLSQTLSRSLLPTATAVSLEALAKIDVVVTQPEPKLLRNPIKDPTAESRPDEIQVITKTIQSASSWASQTRLSLEERDLRLSRNGRSENIRRCGIVLFMILVSVVAFFVIWSAR
jgi:hypothetical protein